ncbi:MAG: alpha-ketoglutarate-dependent 2,4-dichlorophenoxyacetate dioxygenase, partial [Hyphomicrobiaceae bacterium]
MSKMSSLQIKQVGPGFVGEVSGLDISKPLTPVDVAAISAGMDAQAVLVFRGQNLTNDQQLAFTNALGHLEDVVATSLRAADDNRLPAVFADVSNLDKDNKTFALDDRRRLFAIGNRLWHSDSSFKVIPARYSLLYSHSVTSRGGNTEFANMRMAYDAFDQETKDLVEDLVCEHSQIFSRQKLGFTDFSPEERERFKPVLQRLVRIHPSTGKKSIYLSSHAG